ncbi:MAG: hypothetical protein JWN68_2509 [Nocardioides sp.]|nr:hypothetical protein [Nocardioides sp.]
MGNETTRRCWPLMAFSPRIDTSISTRVSPTPRRPLIESLLGTLPPDRHAVKG